MTRAACLRPWFAVVVNFLGEVQKRRGVLGQWARSPQRKKAKKSKASIMELSLERFVSKLVDFDFKVHWRRIEDLIKI